ncbi:MAG TPA: SgcJ/EcaC family oxidoreductase [Longimicrobiaceae bacterium]
MTDTLAPAAASLHAEIATIVQALQDAWNAGDGAGFTAPFADDADFVNIMGMHVRGRDAIAAGHEHIFRTLYAGSRIEYRLKSARLLRPDVALAHVDARLHVPAGPMAGDMAALWSAVLTRDGGGWRIASFHNTRLQERP